MGTTYTYTFSLGDRIAPAACGITALSPETAGVLKRLGDQAQTLQNRAKDCGGSLGALRAKPDGLKKGKELLPVSDLKRIDRYNRETEGLTRQIDKLDRAARSGGMKNAPGALGGFVRPARLGAEAVGAAVKSGMSFDENMAKANITARLKGAEYQTLKDRTLAVAAANKSDAVDAAATLGQIISQTGDLDLSMSILDATLKGAKAQFADTDAVAGALARTLSIVGKENTSAQEVLDTFVAAKRVGAGEFKDFAQYMPNLIAGADALGIGYKEVAGAFAYMTGKGRPPDRANVLLENLFTALGRGEVRDKLSKSGIEVYDRAGRIRSLPDIFQDMRQVTAAMTDQQRDGFIERLGIGNPEAKNAFLVMTADVDKLADSLTEVAHSAGETERAMEYARNTAMTATEVWNQFRAIGVQVGTAILPVISAGLEVVGGLLTVVTPLVGGVVTACGWWFDALRGGNPAIWGLTAAGAAAGVMLTVHRFKLMEAATWSRAAAFATGFFTRAIGFLRTAFLTTPWGWVAVGIGTLAGGIASLTSKTDRATESFAAFHTELAKSKDETAAAFDAAMQATEGSELRAAAIRKINEQYGEYLPNLLTEKSTNDELRGALDRVNAELERKIRNKFRDQAMTEVQEEAEKERTDVLNYLLDHVDESKQQALANDFEGVWERIKTGRSDWKTESKHLQDKYQFNGGWRNIYKSGVNFSGRNWSVYNHIDDEIIGLQNAAYDLSQSSRRIGLLYGSDTVPPVTNGFVSPFVDGVYDPGRAVLTAGAGVRTPTGPALPAGGNDKEASGLPGLIPVAALPVPVASAQLAAVASAAPRPQEWFAGNRPQQVSIGAIEIHIARMDDQGRETITEEVETAILNALNVV